jgi:hypothetical protein
MQIYEAVKLAIERGKAIRDSDRALAERGS